MRLPSRSSADLASRVFNNKWFAVPWVTLLTIAVFRFWWIRDAMLVCWKYGCEAYHRDPSALRSRAALAISR